ncbi:NUDIX hydrolase [Streptomyces sp. NPDC058231]|uniref:NUDIX hydrolase n=1 Tax=Streptomyces sp. NPDC058231 TaxID=3346392 RepID=UPI0036E8BF20
MAHLLAGPAAAMIDSGMWPWQSGVMRIPRRAARVAVLDPAGSVFMFRYDNEEVGVHWAMPGGGLEPGESPLRAAGRELREETGWTDIEIDGTTLCLWEHDFTRAGVPVRQHEHIFLARGPRRDPVGDLAAAHAADRILRWRWWSPDDLSGDREPLWPPQLPGLLTDVRRNGAPAAPVDLGHVRTGAADGR